MYSGQVSGSPSWGYQGASLATAESALKKREREKEKGEVHMAVCMSKALSGELLLT